jgi:hypothetical protein
LQFVYKLLLCFVISKSGTRFLLSYQKLLREDRFADGKRDLQEEEELLGLRIPSQIVSCLSEAQITDQAPDVQRDLMRLLLCLSCDYPWALTYRVLTEEYALCLAAYASVDPKEANGGNGPVVMLGGSSSSAMVTGGGGGGGRSQVQAGARGAFCHSLRAYAQFLGMPIIM